MSREDRELSESGVVLLLGSLLYISADRPDDYM